MDIMFIQEFISPITLVACLCVGYVIKNLVPNDEINRFIPLVVTVIGVAMSVWAEADITPSVICSGMVSGLASTGLYEAFAQLLLKHRVTHLEMTGNADLHDKE